ncbi:hypothetical protein F5Y04DRAFT_9899 [Hypomontagnella monticulosa]|nr:hypothetical protein F5Y04DRAFT_9899 [Hypomontagnella monticulosa]
MAPQATRARHDPVLTQPGSRAKKWNKVEIRKCGAIGTTELRDLNLRGDVHPIFANWVDADPGLRRELEQPLLLASRILEAAGLPWMSDFLSHDIFTKHYPGRQPSCRCSFTHSAAAPEDSSELVPRTIVRHHRAVWAEPELKEEWIRNTEDELNGDMASATTWQLDADMHHERGWVGYTCRHPRGELALDELDKYETIQRWDRECENGKRKLTILLAAEFPKRLAELRSEGKERSEEYLLTSFMAAITILHELGHAAYWRDCRALTRDLHEPYYGASLEMELGDSFIASIFGGWLPIPIRTSNSTQGGLDFSEGLAWKQSLSWDFHRMRPKHRTHYSIPVDYVAQLFSEERWLELHQDPVKGLIQPQSLEPAVRDVGICAQVTTENRHATAAIADFHCAGQGWKWDRLPGARFRIPQYDGYLCPDLDLPIATDDVIEEPKPLPQLKPSPMPPDRPPPPPPLSSSDALLSPRPEMFPKPPRQPVIRKLNNKKKPDPASGRKPKKTPPGFIRLAKEEQTPLSPDRNEISLDELRHRLSELLGVSLNELQEFFEASRCA